MYLNIKLYKYTYKILKIKPSYLQTTFHQTTLPVYPYDTTLPVYPYDTTLPGHPWFI